MPAPINDETRRCLAAGRVSMDPKEVVMNIVQSDWRTLAEPTYGVGAMGPERGETIELIAGQRIRLRPNGFATGLPDMVIVEAGPGVASGPSTHWFVTASALRFDARGRCQDCKDDRHCGGCFGCCSADGDEEVG